MGVLLGNASALDEEWTLYRAAAIARLLDWDRNQYNLSLSEKITHPKHKSNEYSIAGYPHSEEAVHNQILSVKAKKLWILAGDLGYPNPKPEDWVDIAELLARDSHQGFQVGPEKSNAGRPHTSQEDIDYIFEEIEKLTHSGRSKKNACIILANKHKNTPDSPICGRSSETLRKIYRKEIKRRKFKNTFLIAQSTPTKKAGR